MSIIDSDAVSHGAIEQNTLLIDIATRNVVCLTPGDSIGEAARIMAEKRISCIAVTDGDGHPLGIVTERNMLHAMQSECPAETTLREVMSSPVITVPESMTCLDAYQVCLRDGIRHLLIVDDSKLLLGVVSETDFRRHINLSVLAGRRQVASVMSRSVFTQPPQTRLRDVLNLMHSHRDSCVVVVEAERPIGIVTERDIVRLYSCAPERIEIPIRAIMTSPVLTISLENSINDAAERMLTARVRHLVVVDHAGQVAGLLSEHDLTHTMALRLIDDKLIEEGAFLHTLLNTIPDMLWLKDVNGIYRACNARFERFFGAKAHDIIGKTDYDFVDRELADIFRAHDRMAMAKNGPTINQEWIAYADDGHRELLETLKMPMRDSLGKLIGVLGFSRDITERKQAEQALLESEGKLREQKELLASVLESSLDAFMLMNAEGVITIWSSQAEKMFGWKREEAVGRLMHETIAAPRYREAHARGMRHFLSTGEGPVLNTRIEVSALHRDGHEFPVELSISLIKTAAGCEISSFVRDITQRKRMEQQLDDYRKLLEEQVAEESTKFRALVEQSLVGNYIIQDGMFRYVNSGFAKMFGYDSPDELVGQIPVLQIVAPEERERVVENIRKRLSGEIDRVRFSFIGCKRDGTVIVADVHGRTIEYQGKAAIIGTLVDITETRRNQDELERLVDEKASKLRRSEEKLRTLIEAIPDPIQFKDGEGRWLESNLAARQVFGLENFDCHGKTDEELSQIAAPPFREPLLQCPLTDEQAWHTNGVSRLEEIIPLDDGSKLFFDVIKKPLFHEDGKRAGLVIVGRDVTELRRSQEALAEREELFRTVFDQAPSGIELIDPDTLRFIEANPATCDMLGYTHEEYLQLRLTDTQADMDEQALIAAVRQVEASGGMTLENRHRCKNGDILDVEVNARILDFPGKRLLVGVWRDITEHKRAGENLAAREREFRTLAENSPDNIARYDCKAHILYANPTLERTLGRTSADLTGKTPVEIVPGELFEDYQQTILYVGATGESTSYEQIVPAGEEQRPPIHFIRLVAEMGADGTPVGVLAVGRDITDIKRAEENLRITASVFDNSQEALLITDANNIIIEVNPAFTRITGFSRDEVLGRNPKLLSSGRQDPAFYAAMWQSLKQEKVWRGEIWNRRKSGEVYAELLSISAICDDNGNVQRYVGVFSDINYLKEHEAELSRVAHYDALTGIPNRVLLADRMKQAIAKSARERNVVAVCYLDLDGFKAINDNLGHDAGDQVLVEVAKRIENAIRGGDTVARLGGDEFVVLLELEKGEECIATLERLLAVIAQPITVKDKPQMLSASIGVSIYPLDDKDSDTLLRHADQAMYVAKQSGKNCFYIYDPELDLRTRNHNEFLKNIRHGLENNQFELYFQPKINLHSKQLVGAEALIRWRHPERGLLSPIEFLRPIENTELDIEIGNWVITSALAQINRWHGAGLGIEISINISAYHLESPGFTEKLRQQLARYAGIASGTLQIEILETAALNDLSVVRKIIDECREFGVGFALDDFGTGYSSLSYLSRLPVDVLKIDQSFVRDMLEDNGDKAIVQGIIALAKAFDRQIVAEGIETEEHYRVLLDMGCQIGQGYAIARPMPAEQLTNWRIE